MCDESCRDRFPLEVHLVHVSSTLQWGGGVSVGALANVHFVEKQWEQCICLEEQLIKCVVCNGKGAVNTVYTGRGAMSQVYNV